jgi:hypothetical protein
LDKVPVSDLCDELGLQPTVFYRWQKEFFENGAASFSGKRRPNLRPTLLLCSGDPRFSSGTHASAFDRNFLSLTFTLTHQMHRVKHRIQLLL